MSKKTPNQVLIIDDEPDIRELLELTLGRMNLETRAAACLDDARHLLNEFHFDLCLTDMKLPDGNGIDFVRSLQDTHPELPVAVITAYGSMETAITALKAGAFDFISKPVDLDDLRNIVRAGLRVAGAPATSKIKAKSRATGAENKMQGESEAIEKVRQMINKLARGQAPVYISGDSGTGKELAARLIHELGPRKDAPFVPVNCGAIPEHLMESEFFGHKKGSFTGATSDKDGLFRAADGGTLFLDEVGDLPLHMQVKMLRAIQERSIRPVGTEIEVRVDIRILSATHKDLRELVKEGDFRQDLYYRLNVIELLIPPLQQRPGDIPVLANSLAKKLADQMGIALPQISDEAMDKLQHYSFPGNVRELENILERALTLCDSNNITAEDLQLHEDLSGESQPGSDTVGKSDESLDDYMARVERVAIEDALSKTNQNKTAAAKLLGITFRALRYKLEKLGID
ncbi:MAG: two-component system response regulator PilR [Gammaproteobacteria bacterium]|nr:MAG: two-component system response regulator PilR [Gammaproteobacteria bacterium]